MVLKEVILSTRAAASTMVMQARLNESANLCFRRLAQAADTELNQLLSDRLQGFGWRSQQRGVLNKNARRAGTHRECSKVISLPKSQA